MKKTVFITGSTRGIGKTTALAFAQMGYEVILNGRKKNQNSELFLQQIKKFSPQSTIFYFDITNKKETENLCRKIINKFKKIDVLVNNAGTLRDKTFLKMDFEDWDTIIKTNLYGAYYITKNILPVMIKNNWGRIINVSSIIGIIGNFGQTNYSASKAAIIGFTKSLAKETAKYGVTVNAVSPGLVETDILKDVPKEYMNKLLEKIPLGRMAHTQEVADLILFLASEKSSYITGENININGGWF